MGAPSGRKAKVPITKRQIAAIHNFYSLAADNGPVEIPKARAPRVTKPRTEPSEAEILKAIMALLKRHPKVAKVWRQNSGTFQMQYGDKTRYVRANTAKGMADIQGILKTGKSFFIEVKSAKGKLQPNQVAFLHEMADAGAIAFVARKVEDVMIRLENA